MERKRHQQLKRINDKPTEFEDRVFESAFAFLIKKQGQLNKLAQTKECLFVRNAGGKT